jgi:large subunit ribosomal protein L11
MYFFDKVIETPRSDDVESLIFLKIRSRSANSGPPIGPILGQYGIPAAPFCSEFNERTSIFRRKREILVTIYLYRSGLYDFCLGLPSTCSLLKSHLHLGLSVKEPGMVPFPYKKNTEFPEPAFI